MTRHSVHELFIIARGLPHANRMIWLGENCDDASIRAEVQELLSFDKNDHFMEVQVVEMRSLDVTQSYLYAGAAPNHAFSGRYKLLQQIGEGGFGVVYMADQIEPVRRRVAIKLLRSSLDSRSVVARFESERQALALMDHPNIAKVFDGGITEDGTPYFVMELVNGASITNFCDENRLTNTERMKLLMIVCQAVQHAHHKGIIHRDLKPTNILVSLMDGLPVPKVIDFGIAKAMHGPLTDKTFFTSFQQMIGTPEYMSPEQAETSIVDVDTRSDIFSLGVLAYELLTGTTPFDGGQLRKLGLAEIQRTIREIDPPKPSDRVSTFGEQSAIIASKRGLPVSGLPRSIQSDLDWIVMKAMEKDRNRRYASAQSLSDDLNRWLQGEPIEARPPSYIYRTTKLIRKHRATALATAIVLLGSLVAAIGLGYGMSERKASLQRERYNDERNRELLKLAQFETDRIESLEYGNAMIAAKESFINGRRQTTIDLLKACPENKRGLEWKWLSFLASDRSKTLIEGNLNGGQLSMAFPRELDRLYSAGSDGMLHLWNTLDEQVLQSWRIANEPIVDLDCSSDDKYLLACTESGKLIVWAILRGEAIDQIAVGTKLTIAEISESSNENRLIACGKSDGTVLLWKGSLNKEPMSLTNSTQALAGSPQTLEFIGEGEQLLVAGKGGATLYDTNSGEILKTYGNSWQSYWAIPASDLDKLIIYGPPLVIVDRNNFDDARVLDIPSTGYVHAAFDTANHSVILVTEDQSVRRVDIVSGKQETLGYLHTSGNHKVAASNDGRAVATIDNTGSLKLLKSIDYAAPQLINLFNNDEVASIAIDKSQIAYVLSDMGKLAKVDLGNGVAVTQVHAHTYQGFSLAIDSSGQTLYSNGLDQKLSFWSTESLVQRKHFDLALGARYLALHPDGDRLAGPIAKDIKKMSIDELEPGKQPNANLALWNTLNGRVDRFFDGLTNWAMKLRFSSNGAFLAAATISDGAVVWGVETDYNKKLKSAGMPQVDDVVFTHDSKRLIVAYHSGQVYVWNLSTSEVERKIVCHGDQISGLLITEDGNRLITCSASDSQLRVWDWRTGQKVAEFETGVDRISELKFDEASCSFLIGGKDGQLATLRVSQR